MKKLSNLLLQSAFSIVIKKNIYLIKKYSFTLLIMGINSHVFAQFYVGNNLTNKGVTITPGILFNNNTFVEAEGVINASDNFVFAKYSLGVGKQFLIMGNNGDEDRCFKIKPSIGATISKVERTIVNVQYKTGTNSYKYDENVYRTSNINMNYKVELIWHKQPFDYFILAGYSNGFYSGIGWRGIVNKRAHF
jgi:hypothetical protein